MATTTYANGRGRCKGVTHNPARKRNKHSQHACRPHENRTLKSRRLLTRKKTVVEHYLHRRGHLAYFLPKFHCELNAIERVWAQAKVYCRAHTNFTLVKLRQLINPTLNSVSVDLIRKYTRKARNYEQAYRDATRLGKMWKMQLESISLIEKYLMKILITLN